MALGKMKLGKLTLGKNVNIGRWSRVDSRAGGSVLRGGGGGVSGGGGIDLGGQIFKIKNRYSQQNCLLKTVLPNRILRG